MKKFLIVLIGITAASATMLVLNWRNHPTSSTKIVNPSVIAAASSMQGSPHSVALKAPDAPQPGHVSSDPMREVANNPATTPPSATVSEPSVNKPSVTAGFSPPLQTLVSLQSSYLQKQAAWKELQDTHQLDRAISDLERVANADSSGAQYSAALGEAYVQKLRALQDFREQSILAIKADQTFDQALKLDPSNWEARYWKALSLSYWPEALNKTGEVIDNLVTLVQQQESQSPQPQFAQTYLLLGEQYLKVGYTDDAREAWRRGASRFPGDNLLR